MKVWLSGVVGATMIFCTSVAAAPVEFDTAEAHVIVLRPVDAWSGDATLLEDMLQSIQGRRCSYAYFDSTGHYYRGSPLPFQGMSDTPITHGVMAALTALKASLVSNDRYMFTVHPPSSLVPGDFNDLVQAQNALFKRAVIQQGNPSTLQSRLSHQKILGGMGALAATVFTMGKLGVDTGSKFMLDTGLADNVYRVSAQTKDAIAPLALPTFDARSYAQIDVRRVTATRNTLGQIIIAYKTPPTEAAETTALIQAIVVLTGADINTDDVQHSRSEDLALRQSIWDACVAEGKCKND